MKNLHSYNDELHIDVMREIGNIGSGNAATSLSQMIGHPVDIAISDIGITGCNEAIEKLGGAETVMAGVLLLLSGDLDGMMMFLLPRGFACKFINTLMFTNLNEFSEIDEMAFSAISEIANIMTASFVNAISQMTGMFIDISPPSSTIDMLGAVMSVPAVYFAHISDKIIFIKNELILSSEKAPANIILMPDIDSLDKLMKTLGIGA